MSPNLRTILLAVALSPLCTLTSAACGGADVASEEDNATGAVKLEPLDVSAASPSKGVKILKSKAEFEKFFGQAPPAGVDFKKHWVVHVSMGKASTGGYSVEILKIERAAGATKTLVVHARFSKPGAGCSVTKQVTYPQLAVRINKQPSTPAQKLVTEAKTYACNDPSLEELIPLVDEAIIAHTLFDDEGTSCSAEDIENHAIAEVEREDPEGPAVVTVSADARLPYVYCGGDPEGYPGTCWVELVVGEGAGPEVQWVECEGVPED
jgi:hypothetical protein